MLFRLVKHNDINTIKKLIDDAFGLNYLTLNDITTYIEKKDCFGYCLIDQNKFVGFIFLKTYSSSNIKNFFLKEQEWFFNHIKNIERVSIIEQIALVAEYREKGLSNQLLNNALSKIEQHCDLVMSVCWLKAVTTPMQKLLQKNNFKSIKTIANYWQDDSLAKKYSCSICGVPPCNCSAEVYELKKPFKI